MRINLEEVDGNRAYMTVDTPRGESALVISEEESGITTWQLHEECHKCDAPDCYGYPLLGGMIDPTSLLTPVAFLESLDLITSAARYDEYNDYQISLTFDNR